MSLKGKSQERAMRSLESAMKYLGPKQKPMLLAGLKSGMVAHYDSLVKDNKVPQIEDLSEFNMQLVRISRVAGITLEDFKRIASEVLEEKRV